MRIVIDVIKEATEVTMEAEGLSMAEALNEYMCATRGLIDTYNKLVKDIKVPEDSLNSVNALTNMRLKESVDEFITYEDTKETNAIFSLCKALDVIFDKADKNTLDELKKELDKED